MLEVNNNGEKDPGLGINVDPAGMVFVAGALSKRGYATWYAPVQSLERHRTFEMILAMASIRRELKGCHVPQHQH